MKFEISSSAYWDEDELLKAYPLLSKKYNVRVITYKIPNWQNEMINHEELCIEINELKQLLDFENDFGRIIISSPFYEESPCDYAIEIYDGYRE